MGIDPRRYSRFRSPSNVVGDHRQWHCFSTEFIGHVFTIVLENIEMQNIVGSHLWIGIEMHLSIESILVRRRVYRQADLHGHMPSNERMSNGSRIDLFASGWAVSVSALDESTDL